MVLFAQLVTILAVILPQPRLQETEKAAPEAQAAPAKSDPAAIAFLSEKVDKVMYNIVTAGATTARGKMKLTMPMMGDLEVRFQWRKEPWKIDCDIKLPAQLTEMDNPQMTAMKKMIESQMTRSAQEALLLPFSRLADHNVVTMAEDGDLVTLSFKPTEESMIEEARMSFTKVGKLVRQVMVISSPMGKIESTNELELMPADEKGKTFLVKKTVAKSRGMQSTRVVTYGESNGFKVVDKSTETGPMGSQETEFEVEVNVPLDPASPAKGADKTPDKDTGGDGSRRLPQD